MKKVGYALLAMIASLAACDNDTLDSETQGELSGNVVKSSAQPRAAIPESVPELRSFAADFTNNPYAYIPPQCFTDPVDQDSSVKNPCYACHTISKEPNYFNDTDVQFAYAFPEDVEVNHWTNLFKDRSEYIESTSDNDILSYVRSDNYFDKNGGIKLANALAKPPAEWDRNNDGKWSGYIPDVYFNFDDSGFDHDPTGSYTGWRVFAYYPFEGTFFPTNGSTDDVMIRLDAPFQRTDEGEFDLDIYRVNLAIVEAMIKRESIQIPQVDEKHLGVDIDRDGELGMASQVTYDWAPLEKRFMSYVGQAKVLLDAGKIHIAGGLYPEGTEFAHSVRYLDVNGRKVTMAQRMKEFRYSKKVSWRNYYKLREIVNKEIKERHDFPDRLKTVYGNMEEGMATQYGWIYQGYIEDQQGELRPQTYEETLFCMGCHSNIGAQADTTLSFARKFGSDSMQQGWYHWIEKGLQGIPDGKREDGTGVYAFYLKQNPHGNEYRTNYEVKNKFFNADGSEKPEAFAALEEDISYLLLPSPERALKLNKAYKAIVDEQSYRLGRDAVLEPFENVHRRVEIEDPTGITKALTRH